MGILDLRDKTYAEKRTPAQVDYDTFLETPTKSYKTPGIEDIYPAVSEASKGGGIKGILKGSLAGLGKLGEVMNTSTGQKIMAGLSNDPYMGEAFLNEAGQSREQELAQTGLARQSEMARMNSIGEIIRQKAKEEADLKRETAVKQMEIEAAQPSRLADISNKELMAKLGYAQLERQQKADIEQTAVDKQKADLAEKELEAKPEIERKKNIVDAAQQAFNKGKISAEDLSKISTNPTIFEIKDRGLWSHIIPFVKTSTVVAKTPEFATEQEAEAANLPAGTEIVVNGRRARIQ